MSVCKVPIVYYMAVDAPHFNAGVVWHVDKHGRWKCIEAAPVLSWAKGKRLNEVKNYCFKKGWKCTIAKECTRCWEHRLIQEYGTLIANADKRQTYCKYCINVRRHQHNGLSVKEIEGAPKRVRAQEMGVRKNQHKRGG